VAAVAGIEVRSCCELVRVPVAVAIGAALELYLEERLLTFRNMTLRALQASMTTLQRICRRSVLFHGEKGRLPSLHVMARSTFTTIDALGKLPVVRILVAIHTLLEGQGFLEISTRMALRAVYADVFA